MVLEALGAILACPWGLPGRSQATFWVPRSDPDDKGARSRGSGRGPRRVEKSPETDFLEVQGGQSAPFCSFKHVDLVDFRGPQIRLGALGGALGVSWGLMFGSQEAQGRSWGSMFGPQGPSGRPWGTRARDERVQRGPWTSHLALQRRVLDAKVAIFLVFFDDFQKHCFFKGWLQGGVA